MNKYLTEAVKRDNRKSQNISPISKLDAEIFFEIIQAFKKLNRTELVDILSKYKGIKDEDVFNLLLSWNTEFNLGSNDEEQGEDSDPSVRKCFITIEDELIDAWNIARLTKREDYCHQQRLRTYKIIINEGVDGNNPIKDIEFEYLTSNKREKVWRNLRMQLSEMGVKFQIID